MRIRGDITIITGLLTLGTVSGAWAEKVTVYSHPKAVAAPTKPVMVKDLDPTMSELEAILNKAPDNGSNLAESTPPATKQAMAQDAGDVPSTVAPVQIIPPPSELLAEADLSAQNQDGMLDRIENALQQWARKWIELVNTFAMVGVFLFTGLLYVTSRGQYKVLRRAVKAAETAALSAKQAADAAEIAASVSPAVERAYVFLDPGIHGSVTAAGEQGEPAKFTIKFAFRNYGKTPAIVMDLQASGSYWSTGYPETLHADSHSASEGMMIGSGEKSSPFTLVFSVGLHDLQQAYNGVGQLLFWGKLLYRDMFGELRETAFCRAYRFDDKAFRVVPVEKLNYHT